MKEEIAIVGCAGAVGIFILAIVALVFVGCPMAASYGASPGCAAGAEHAR